MALVGTGRALRDMSLRAVDDVAQIESARKQERQMVKQADRQMKGSLAGTGAAIGLSAGLGSAAMGAQFGAAAGPIGLVGGAAIGYLAGSLF